MFARAGPARVDVDPSWRAQAWPREMPGTREGGIVVQMETLRGLPCFARARPRALRPVLSLSLALVALGPGPARAEDRHAGWQELENKRGITVSEREVSGKGLPWYRGQAEVPGSVLQVLAVVLDDARSKEWAKDVKEARVLRSVDPHTEIVYSRSDQTWPVRDRDLVMKRTVQVLRPGEEFRVRLVCVPEEKKEVHNVVRIKQCETVFLLRKLDANTTFVDMEMHVEPGGHHPEWAVRHAAQSVPYDTLSGLRKQVKKTAGQYAAEIHKWQR
jgi:hypothetical protein